MSQSTRMLITAAACFLLGVGWWLWTPDDPVRQGLVADPGVQQPDGRQESGELPNLARSRQRVAEAPMQADNHQFPAEVAATASPERYYEDWLTPVCESFLTPSPNPGGLLAALSVLGQTAVAAVEASTDEHVLGTLSFPDSTLEGSFSFDRVSDELSIEIVSPADQYVSELLHRRSIGLVIEEASGDPSAQAFVRFLPREARQHAADGSLEELRARFDGRLVGYGVTGIGHEHSTTLTPYRLEVRERNGAYLIGQRSHPGERSDSFRIEPGYLGGWVSRCLAQVR